MLVLSLIAKGQPAHPRFLIANQNKQFWTGDGWSHEEDDGLLFADETEVGDVCTEILTEYAKHESVFRFTAPVTIEIRSEEPPDFADVQLWLMKAARLFVDCGQPGLSDATAILSINWLELKEVGE
ncbi:MAG: hypothetical protein ABGZ35_33260 [Planctomycetaceae bacterium]|jgi:hypothetical protein